MLRLTMFFSQSTIEKIYLGCQKWPSTTTSIASPSLQYRTYQVPWYSKHGLICTRYLAMKNSYWTMGYDNMGLEWEYSSTFHHTRVCREGYTDCHWLHFICVFTFIWSKFEIELFFIALFLQLLYIIQISQSCGCLHFVEHFSHLRHHALCWSGLRSGPWWLRIWGIPLASLPRLRISSKHTLVCLALPYIGHIGWVNSMIIVLTCYCLLHGWWDQTKHHPW